jgi:hypothetical protein
LELIRADEVQSNFCIFSTVQFPWWNIISPHTALGGPSMVN